jgi:hypothetical protein
VAPRRLRLLGALLAGALLAAALAGAGGARGSASGPAPAVTSPLARAIDALPGTALRAQRLAAVTATWRGGPITTSAGETVRVFVSDTYPVDQVTPEAWAEFLSGLAHGPELALVTVYIAPLAEVQELCGDQALGCYSANRIVSIGDALPDDASPEEVLRHEYGHHVAFHRLNPPWPAIDWGPKRWASAAGVCARVVRKEAFPGNEGGNYAQNPGEAWAEVYRLMDERRAGITTGRWTIIAPSFYPDEAALQAAERDVLEPWTGSTTTVFRRVFGKRTKKVWWIPLSTALDGELQVRVSLPRNGLHEVALVGPNRTTVLGRAQWVGQSTKRASATVCGQRTLFLRVTQRGALGRVTVLVTAP